uniref:Nucleoside-diphosphatase mig-23 n=1 Tax=Syphacia muris TaxID=451379 RepID=A0A0N5AH45_9BILA
MQWLESKTTVILNIYVCFLYNPLEYDLLDWSYGVIIDAGSTGSRLFLYRWKSISESKLIDIHPVLDGNDNPVVKKIKPGLSSFADAPLNATDYIKPLFDYVIKYVPQSKVIYTPVFIFATAGMRLLPESAQNAILKNIRTNLPLITPLQVIPENIRVIQGKWEGIYSWIAINYILGRFNENKSEVNRSVTVGMADMGGASVQIAFELEESDTGYGNNYEEVNLGCSNNNLYRYRLFVTTFLGYGVNEGQRKYEDYLYHSVTTAQNDTSAVIIKDPCMPVNLVQLVENANTSYFVRRGSGDWDKCVLTLSQVINTSAETECSRELCFLGKVLAPKRSLSTIELYGFSEYWFSLDNVLSLGGPYNFSAVATKARRFCRQKWNSIRTHRMLYPRASEERLRAQCFKSAWIVAVLHSGFNVDYENNHFRSVLNVEGQEIQWTLGAMLYHLRYFPLRDSQRNLLKGRRHRFNGDTKGSYLILFVIIAIVLLLTKVRR